MILRKKTVAFKKVISLIDEADNELEEISETQIRNELTKPPISYSRNSINVFLDRLAKNKLITKYKRGRENYYTRLKFKYSPIWMFSFISTFEFLIGFFLIRFYEYDLSMQRYYGNVNNGFFVNHHHVVLLFVLIMFIMNFYIALLWKGSLEKYKRIINRL